MPHFFNSKGFIAHGFVLVAAAGLILFILIANTGSFKDKVFSSLFPKKDSLAVAKNGPDLDVTYISRTPRYNRYCVNYPNNIPTPCSGTENQKRWPDVGETVTYTAHVINKGTTATPTANYRWLVNGVVVHSGSIGVLNPNEETSFQFSNSFPSTSETIKFEADTGNVIAEYAEQNNALTITSHDLTISYWVERPLYDIFNNMQNLVGTYSFEDWVQAHISMMNQRFGEAKYPTALGGILTRVRIDKFVVADQLDGVSGNDPDVFLIDGKWQSTDGDPSNNSGLNGSFQNYANAFINTIDWGLNHEITHQLGIIDLYRMNIKNNEAGSPNGGVQVKDINGVTIDYNNLNWPVFRSGGLMGAGETAPYNNGTYYEDHTAGGLNSNHLKRRGYFGEYLFDTPDINFIRVLDGNNNPIGGATVKLYQKDAGSEDIDDIPEHTGVTDSNGAMTVNNRQVNAVTTLTGHTLKPNPFGQINVVGTNGTMIAKVTKGNAEGYGFYRLYDLNVAYWSGNTNSATVLIKTNFPKVMALNSTPGPTAVPTTTTTSLLGDINKNGRVDVFDFNILLSDFGKTDTTSLRSDLNLNGRVDVFDFNILTGNFGKSE